MWKITQYVFIIEILIELIVNVYTYNVKKCSFLLTKTNKKYYYKFPIM